MGLKPAYTCALLLALLTLKSFFFMLKFNILTF